MKSFALNTSKKTKTTPAGEIPVDWAYCLVEALAERGSGHTPDREKPEYWNGGIKWVSLADSNKLDRLYIHGTESEISEAGIRHSSAVLHPKNTVILSRDAGVGKSAILATPMAVSQHFIAWRCGPHLEPIYLYYWLQREKPFFERIAVGSTIKTIGLGEFKKLMGAFPPIDEQHKIAEILTTWDEALTKLDALIEAKDRRKKALMQQLLTGRKRFPGFKAKWKKVALGDVAENISDQNKGRMGTASLYAVTKAEGIVPMRDHVKGGSFARCKRVETDWFAYNPMRINIGSIARWQGAETVMVSGDYVVFCCDPERLLPAYLDHLRQSWMWKSFVTRGGNGGVRIRIYFSDLAEFTFPCPPIEEQQRIAAILDTATAEITNLRAQRTALDQQKRGLMQRLLTGKVRIDFKTKAYESGTN